MDPLATTFIIHDDVVGTAQLAAWIYPPQLPSASFPAIWGLLFPGSTFSGKGYYDLQVPGFAENSYSMARTLAQNGIGIVTFDHLGTGASVCTISGEMLTPHRTALLYSQMVLDLRKRLEQGTLSTDLAPIDPERLFLLGAGHSMGGLVLTELEAACHCFDAVAFFGWGQGQRHHRLQAQDAALAEAMHSDNGYLFLDDRSLLHWFLYGTSPIAPSVIEADDASAVAVPACLFREVIAGNQQQARQITIPVYMGFGQEIDMYEYPRDEPRYYQASHDITCFLLPGSGHCTNFASQRYMLWEHLTSWVYMHAHASKSLLRA